MSCRRGAGLWRSAQPPQFRHTIVAISGLTDVSRVNHGTAIAISLTRPTRFPLLARKQESAA